MTIEVIKGPVLSSALNEHGETIYQIAVVVVAAENQSDIIVKAPTPLKARQARIFARGRSISEARDLLDAAIQTAVDSKRPTDNVDKAMQDAVPARAN